MQVGCTHGIETENEVLNILEFVVHWQDIQFSQCCLKRYSLNKGVYNTIDELLFQPGHDEIVKSRTIFCITLKVIPHSSFCR